jgi:hypothetical protein
VRRTLARSILIALWLLAGAVVFPARAVLVTVDVTGDTAIFGTDASHLFGSGFISSDRGAFPYDAKFTFDVSQIDITPGSALPILAGYTGLMNATFTALGKSFSISDPAGNLTLSSAVGDNIYGQKVSDGTASLDVATSPASGNPIMTAAAESSFTFNAFPFSFSTISGSLSRTIFSEDNTNILANITSVTYSGSCAADLKSAVQPHLLDIVSLSGEPIDIVATFTPSTGVSLSQAEMDCGVSHFDWQQTINRLPSPSPFFANDEPDVPITAPPAVLDPPPSGYTYPLACPDGTISSASNDAFPFYYAVGGPANDCMSLSYHEDVPSSLDFFDSPEDSCLAPDAFLSFKCDFGVAHGLLSFTTTLVGVDSAGNPVALPVARFDDSFSWTDTFDGGCVLPLPFGLSCTGGINPEIIQLNSAVSSDPSAGTGGITITEINGVPVETTVPEPSSIILIAPALVLLIMLRRRLQIRNIVYDHVGIILPRVFVPLWIYDSA